MGKEKEMELKMVMELGREIAECFWAGAEEEKVMEKENEIELEIEMELGRDIAANRKNE